MGKEITFVLQIRVSVPEFEGLEGVTNLQNYLRNIIEELDDAYDIKQVKPTGVFSEKEGRIGQYRVDVGYLYGTRKADIKDE